jgi:adenylate cyclase
LDYILRGRAAELNPPGTAVSTKAIGMFEAALTIDPSSAEARIRLAGELIGRVLNGTSTSSKADTDRAETLIDEALAAWPRSPMAHFVKAQILRAKHLCAEAIPEYETVIESNGNFAGAYANLGQCKFVEGLIEETIPLEEKAIHLSPQRSRFITLPLPLPLASKGRENVGPQNSWKPGGSKAPAAM